MANVFDISIWSGLTTYSKHNVVKQGNFFFYSSINANLNNLPSINSTSWVGLTYHPITNAIIPEFTWLGSFSMNLDISPRVQEIKFGGGFSQIIPDNINSQLLTVELSFAGRGNDEALAIIHFLSARNGNETFAWTAPTIFGKKKLWKCSKFPVSIDFFNNNNIKAVFNETPV